MSKEFEERQKAAFIEYLDASAGDHLSFDMYAQDVSDWQWLANFIPGIVIYSAGGLITFQAEGLIKNHPFYYRESDGMASLSIGGENDDPPYLLSDSLLAASVDISEFRNNNAWISTLMNLVEKLEKAPFRYEFLARKLAFEDPSDVKTMFATDEITYEWGWGHSPEEAFNEMSQISVYLLENGWSEEDQNYAWALRDVNPTPINEDNRVFPTVDFEVKVPEVWRNDNGVIQIPDNAWK